MKPALPGVVVAFLVLFGAVLGLAATLDFPPRLPVSPSLALILSTTDLLTVPFIPSAVHASFTVLRLPCGFLARKSFTNLVLSPRAMAVGMLLSPWFGIFTTRCQ